MDQANQVDGFAARSSWIGQNQDICRLLSRNILHKRGGTCFNAQCASPHTPYRIHRIATFAMGSIAVPPSGSQRTIYFLLRRPSGTDDGTARQS